MSAGKVTLLTGFPTSFLATRVLYALLSADPDGQVKCIVQAKFRDRAREKLGELPESHRERVELLEGDSSHMDLGLAGHEFNQLAAEVDVIHHCAAVTYMGVDRGVAERANVDGAREVLELAEAADHLERLVHWSSALVSGARRGYVHEQELDGSRGFRNVIEETRFRAEKIVREAMDHVPTTILRPSIVIGDSRTGEIDRFDGPYLLVLLMLNAPPDLRIPLPGRGDTPLNVVPVDYVVEAGMRIVRDERSVGRTFHIVDPKPLSARRVFELIARATGRPVPRGTVPAQVAAAVLRAPGLERFAHVPRAFLEQLATEVVWDDRNTRELLEGSGIRCPALETYVDTVVRYVRDQQAARRAKRAEERIAQLEA
ncbi:MAG: SDR family oxidoreductase [Myxococcota bacterium]